MSAQGRVFRLLIPIFCAVAAALTAAEAAQARYASIVIDAHSGDVLHQRYADKPLHPASLTKMMTLYMVFEALERGDLRLEDRLRVSRHAESMPASKLYLEAGETIRLEDAILSLVTKSANDVAVVIAEAIGGSEANFAKQMTTRAHSLGMRDTVFRNASGLHHPRQVTTARDMARLAQLLIFRYRPYYSYFNTHRFEYQGRVYRTHNDLLQTYPGSDGLKTGYIRASGFNLVSSAVREGRRLIGVVFGGRTARTRNSHMAKLLDAGFARARRLDLPQLAIARPPAPEHKPTPFERATEIALAAPQPTRKPGRTTLLSRLNPISEAQAGTVSDGGYDSIPIIYGEGDANTALVSLLQRSWSIQVGAFARRDATQRAIFAARRKAPELLTTATPAIVPLDNRGGTVYRARLTGLDRKTAVRACGEIDDCFVLAPQPIR